MTPGTTAPSSEADVADTGSGDLERLAAAYTMLTGYLDEGKEHTADILESGYQLRKKKMQELSTLDELLASARQVGQRLHFTGIGGSAVGASGGDSATTSTTLVHALEDAETPKAGLHDLQEREATQNGDIESLRHQLAARTLEIENLQVRQDESNKRMAAHGDDMHSLRNQLATRQPPTNEGVARLLSLSNCFMAHGRFNDPFLDYMASEERRLNVLVAWQVWVSAILAWLCLMLAWLFYKISAAP
ncbi:hypothetical protein LTR74_003643 [Friedmanniomyces endolithicus]|nr:hypothetical protein LTR74_003643 [Friedmanniomyces endolithicus]